MADDEILQDLRAAGLADGHGSFTVDAAAAWEKARTHQVLNPFEYAGFFVRSAVAAGAASVQMYRLPHLVLMHSGKAPPFRELSRLPEHLMAEREDSVGLRDLATAVNAALALPHSRVEVQSWDGPHWRAVHFDGRGQAMRDCDGRAPRKPGQGLRMTVWRRAVLGGEAPLLRRVCRFTPIPVRVDAWAANAPVFEEPQEDLSGRLNYGQNEVRRHTREIRVFPLRPTTDCFALRRQEPRRVELRTGLLDVSAPTPVMFPDQVLRRRLPVPTCASGSGSGGRRSATSAWPRWRGVPGLHVTRR